MYVLYLTFPAPPLIPLNFDTDHIRRQANTCFAQAGCAQGRLLRSSWYYRW
jgi:hypothetical protein